MNNKVNFIHGSVSKKHYEWYRSLSGTFWNGSEWVVDGEAKTVIEKIAETNGYKNGKKYSKGDLINQNILKAYKFEQDMIDTKKYIIDQMPKGVYAISNSDIFDFMRFKKCKIKYEYQGTKYITEIK